MGGVSMMEDDAVALRARVLRYVGRDDEDAGSTEINEVVEAAARFGVSAALVLDALREPAKGLDHVETLDAPYWLREGNDLHQPLDNDKHSEPEEAQMRQRLGLRPRFVTSRHPDTRPCPPWCVIGDADDHTVTTANPTSAWHHSESVEVVATKYDSTRIEAPDGEVLLMRSTFDLRLDGFGQAEPVVRLLLDDRSSTVRPTELRMALVDAEEVVVGLQYLTAVARAAREI